MTAGNYHVWAEQWAIDSVQQAQQAYNNIILGSASIDGQRLRIAIELPNNYIDSNQSIAAEQLAKAGLHLAQLLNVIQWK